MTSDVLPASWPAAVGEVEHIGSVDVLQSQSATAAAVCGIADDEVCVNDQARTGSVAGQHIASRCRKAILVGRNAARRILVGSAHDEQSTAVGCNRRVRALVEQDGIVL